MLLIYIYNMEIFKKVLTTTLMIGMLVDSRAYGFQCEWNQESLPSSKFCDFNIDCRDGSDEIIYNSTIHTEEDGIPCLSEYYDEMFCLLHKNMSNLEKELCRQAGSCHAYSMKCWNGTGCFERRAFCGYGGSRCRDGYSNALYNKSYHKEEDGISCAGANFFMESTKCLLQSEYVCDGIIDCLDKSDECNCQESKYFCDASADCPHSVDECFCKDGTQQLSIFSDYKCFRCLDRSKIIPASQLCDGIVQCQDLSDECLCQTKKGDKLLAICNDICWGEACVCSGRLYCSTREQAGKVCLQKRHMCDDNFDCLSKLDEEYCEKKITCADGGNSGKECDDTCHDMTRAKKCDGIVDCQFGSDECLHCGNSTPRYCKFFFAKSSFSCINGKSLSPYQICDGTPDCNKDSPWESEDEIYCEQTRFYCLPKSAWSWIRPKPNRDYRPTSMLHIPLAKRCDLVSDCENDLDEEDCNTMECILNGTNCTEYTHFYCMDGGNTVYASRDQVCDGNQDCFSSRDECQSCVDGVFSSDDSLISSKPLIPFLTIISIFAVLGNSLVFGHAFKSLVERYRKMSINERNQNSMVLNLAMADLFVGLYTAAISIANFRLSHYGRRYCYRDQEWRSSDTCSALGAILLIGSEQSVFTLTIITAFRLKAICRPFSRTKMRTIWSCMVLSWLISIILAITPLLTSTEDLFVERIWYQKNSFVTRVEREYVLELSRKLITMQNVTAEYVNNIGSVGSWRLLIALIHNLNPSYLPARRFGYYSSHGVCLPRLFPDPKNDASWGFSLAFILINFSSFIFIFVGYIVMFRIATNPGMEVQTNRAAVMQKKVTRIVVTDFICWMPVCIMAFLQISGIDIPKEVYVPVGTILIPINSALNPFLYSDAPEWFWKKTLPLRTSITRRFLSVGFFLSNRISIQTENLVNYLEHTIYTRDSTSHSDHRNSEEGIASTNNDCTVTSPL